MDQTVRLRLATRIHFALLRHYGEDVDPGTLLRGGDAAQEALWVCEASGHDELVSLGRQFSAMQDIASEADLGPPQETAWARDTSGFGVTRADAPADASPPTTAPAMTRWFRPARWLKRASSGSPR